MQASGMSEKAYFYPREGSTVFLSPDNVLTRLCGDQPVESISKPILSAIENRAENFCVKMPKTAG
jgi:hypothetical protein